MSKQDDCGIVSSGFSYRATGFRCCLSPLQNHIALSVKYGINLPLYLVDPPGQEVAAPHPQLSRAAGDRASPILPVVGCGCARTSELSINSRQSTGFSASTTNTRSQNPNWVNY